MANNTFIQNLMKFNLRVLDNGTPDLDATMEDLKNKLFFNQIFVSNTDEMFSKYSMSKLHNTYISAMKHVYSNINRIILRFSMLTNIHLSENDSFERRYLMNAELPGLVITQIYTNINEVHYKFENAQLYYISTLNNNMIAISTIDMKREIYQKPLYKDNFFWKTDDCIRDFIKNDLGAIDTTTIKVTSLMDNDNVSSKVEYNGDTDLMKQHLSIFGRRALVLLNPYLYTKDIEQMIDMQLDKKKEVQEYKNINIKKLLKKDTIIEYPKETFGTYLDLLRSLVEYPETKKLYITLYRIGKDPSLFYILQKAIDKGISVHANIELCATGESINQFWYKELKNIGVHVTAFESTVIKVHAKLTLAEMVNGTFIAQIGTGNYNASTTSQYTDLSLVTSDIEICKMIKKVFNVLDGKVWPEFDTMDLLVTLFNARPMLQALIDREENKGKDGFICIKCNALDDEDIINHLNKAADKGCKIILIIRGVCTWVPQQKNVIVKSIIWDKLEHSRVYCFGKEDPLLYLGSLDLLTNKMEKRIETMVRVKDSDVIMQMCQYLNRYITTKQGAWVMDKEGNYFKQ